MADIDIGAGDPSDNQISELDTTHESGAESSSDFEYQTPVAPTLVSTPAQVTATTRIRNYLTALLSRRMYSSLYRKPLAERSSISHLCQLLELIEPLTILTQTSSSHPSPNPPQLPTSSNDPHHLPSKTPQPHPPPTTKEDLSLRIKGVGT